MIHYSSSLIRKTSNAEAYIYSDWGVTVDNHGVLTFYSLLFSFGSEWYINDGAFGILVTEQSLPNR